MERGLTVEEADAVMGRPFGIPKTGVFGLLDLVGLDLMPHVNASMAGTLAPDDAFHAINREIAAVRPHDRRGLYRPEGQGRLLPARQRRKRAKEAIDLRPASTAPNARRPAGAGGARPAKADGRATAQGAMRGA